ncbi:hypothetical protein CR513_57723, partial [Mucuna pruriens]
MQIGQLATIVSQLQSADSSNLPSQTISNPRGNATAKNYLNLHSSRRRSQPKSTLKQLLTHSHAKRQLSHCRFHLGPSRQGDQSQMKKC